MKISYTVMAHEKRAVWAFDLLRQLPEGSTIVWDNGKGIWDTGKRALLDFGGGSDYHCVLQDDCLLTINFVEKLETVLEDCPWFPLGLYLGGGRPFESKCKRLVDRGDRWVRDLSGPIWGVGIALPSDDIVGLVNWCDRLEVNSYDRRIWAYYNYKKTPCWYPLPSLVDHRCLKENPSILHEGYLDTDRQALFFLP